MTTQAQATSVRSEIVVDAPIERAFAVFIEQFDRIKPREHNLLGVDIAETVFEPRVGGNIYDRGVDGSECRWARVLAYEPPERVVFSWDIGPHVAGRDRPGRASEVEVRFVAETPERTRVELSTATSIATATVGGPARGRRRRRRLAAVPAAVRRSLQDLVLGARAPRASATLERHLPCGRL